MNALSKIWLIYKKEPLYMKLHMVARAILCPFNQLIQYFPSKGKILDIGCGYGLLLHLLHRDSSNKGRELFGIDHDLNKVNIAKICSNSNMEFSHQSLQDLSAETFDAVSVVDVLYAIRFDRWKAFLDNCFRILRPGGQLILKEVIDKPRWKYWIVMLEEKLAIDIFRITQGESQHIESINTYCNALENSSFIISKIQRINAWHWINHCIFVAHK